MHNRINFFSVKIHWGFLCNLTQKSILAMVWQPWHPLHFLSRPLFPAVIPRIFRETTAGNPRKNISFKESALYRILCTLFVCPCFRTSNMTNSLSAYSSSDYMSLLFTFYFINFRKLLLFGLPIRNNEKVVRHFIFF